MAHSPSLNANEITSGRKPTRDPRLSGLISAIWQRVSGLISAIWLWLRALPPRPKALAIGIGILGWAYWPNLQELYTVWSEQPNYSHGFLVIPIALVIFWQRLADTRIDWQASRVPWWSWVLLVAVLAARIFAYERNSQWSENATLVPAVACLMLAIGGWPLLRIGWPAVVFLLFMLPLPLSANISIALPLQSIATAGSVFLMQLTGLWVIAQGNVISLHDNTNASQTLEVARACNGLSMLMTLAATVTATVILIPMATWKRIVVLASAIPIALLSNILRIVATGWCYYLIAGEGAKKRAHDLTGILVMMPLALLLVFLELRVLSWLADDRGQAPRPHEGPERPVLAVYPLKTTEKKKPSAPIDELS